MLPKELCAIKVKAVMTRDLITVNEETMLKEVYHIFETERIHHIPVINGEGKFAGMISKSDMLLLLDWGTKLKLPASERKNSFLLTSNLAKDMMETNILKVSEEDTIGRCVDIFKENYFHALPVTDTDGYLKGLITTYDLMILAYTEHGMINAGL
ncbi:MAG: CBS domain-containing protein [Saprospiraceae bacterium]|nr:CBS domain-containing protein [Saprospiraceae bacterium]